MAQKWFTPTLALTFLNWRKVRTNNAGSTAVRFTPTAVTPVSVSSITRSGKVVTVTTASDHQIRHTGVHVTIAGATQAEYNGVVLVTEVTSTTVFKYELPSTVAEPVTPATGTITLSLLPFQAQRVLLRAPTTNTVDITFGPDSDADFDTLSPGVTYSLEAPHGAKFDLNDWYFKPVSATNNQKLDILFV